jgi:phage-related protein
MDAVNFPGGTNPYGTPDTSAKLPSEVYYVARKVAETRDAVEFEAGCHI